MKCLLLLMLAAYVEGQFDFFSGSREPEPVIDQFGVRNALGSWSKILQSIARRNNPNYQPKPNARELLGNVQSVKKEDIEAAKKANGGIINERILNLLLPRMKPEAPITTTPVPTTTTTAETTTTETPVAFKVAPEESKPTKIDEDWVEVKEGEEHKEEESKSSTTTATTTTTSATTTTTSPTTTTTAAPTTTRKKQWTAEEIENMEAQFVERMVQIEEQTQGMPVKQTEMPKEESTTVKPTTTVKTTIKANNYPKWTTKKVTTTTAKKTTKKASATTTMKPSKEDEEQLSSNDIVNGSQEDEKASIVAKKEEKTEKPKPSSKPTTTTEKPSSTTTKEAVSTKSTKDSPGFTVVFHTAAKEKFEKEQEKIESSVIKILNEKVKELSSREASDDDKKTEKVKETKKSEDKKSDVKKLLKGLEKDENHKKQVPQADEMQETIDDRQLEAEANKMLALLKELETHKQNEKNSETIRKEAIKTLQGLLKRKGVDPTNFVVSDKKKTPESTTVALLTTVKEEATTTAAKQETTTSANKTEKNNKKSSIPEAEEEEAPAFVVQADDPVNTTTTTTIAPTTTTKPANSTPSAAGTVYNLNANANSQSDPQIANVITPIVGLVDGISPLLLPLLTGGRARAAAAGVKNYSPQGRDMMEDADTEQSVIGFGTQLAREILLPGSLKKERQARNRALAAKLSALKSQQNNNNNQQRGFVVDVTGPPLDLAPQPQTGAQTLSPFYIPPPPGYRGPLPPTPPLPPAIILQAAQELEQQHEAQRQAAAKAAQAAVSSQFAPMIQPAPSDSAFVTAPVIEVPPPVGYGSAPPPPPPPPPMFHPKQLTQENSVQRVDGASPDTANKKYFPPKINKGIDGPYPAFSINGSPYAEKNKQSSGTFGGGNPNSNGYDEGRNHVAVEFQEDSGVMTGKMRNN